MKYQAQRDKSEAKGKELDKEMEEVNKKMKDPDADKGKLEVQLAKIINDQTRNQSVKDAAIINQQEKVRILDASVKNISIP